MYQYTYHIWGSLVKIIITKYFAMVQRLELHLNLGTKGQYIYKGEGGEVLV